MWTLDPYLVPCLLQARIGHPSKGFQSNCVVTILDLPALLHKLSNPVKKELRKNQTIVRE